MNKFLIVIVVCALLYSCKPGIPKNIIQPNEMEKVLFDIHVIDGYATELSYSTPDSLKKIISPLYKGVYKKHGIDSALYNHSLDYYYKHPDQMKEMYDHIIAALLKAKDKAQKASDKAAKPVAVDSVNKTNQIVKPAKVEAVEERAVQPIAVN
jgi:hypothetical protein